MEIPSNYYQSAEDRAEARSQEQEAAQEPKPRNKQSPFAKALIKALTEWEPPKAQVEPALRLDYDTETPLDYEGIA
jgi:hypothetical protein